MIKQHERTAYLYATSASERTIRRSTGPLFDAPTLHHLAAGTALHVIDGADDTDAAIRFAVALSGLQFSRHASITAAP